jgi:uncharacterized membrane protein YccC
MKWPDSQGDRAVLALLILLVFYLLVRWTHWIPFALMFVSLPLVHRRSPE